MATRSISFVVNGEPRTVEVHPMKRLLDVLREDLGLTGTKEGCGEGECGACSVIVNDELVNSCLVPVMQVEGARVSAPLKSYRKTASRILCNRRFTEAGGAQCGICTPGMIMASLHLLDRYPAADNGSNQGRAFRQFVPVYRIHTYL